MKCAHDGGDGSAGAEAGDVGVRSGDDLRHHGHDAAGEVEEEKADGSHGVFNLAAEGPEEDHVADDVHPACVHEHRGQQGKPVMAVENADGDCRPGQNECIAVEQFLKEHEYVERHEERGDDGKAARAARCIAQRDHASHYIPPLPRRMPMP